MFGVIELDQKANGSLTEKAGRKDSAKTRAYRQFRSILMNFFLQTAGDFFRRMENMRSHMARRRMN